MESSGQHNLSIALRHILQQIVDSTNPNGHKNTDMTLPHDGYIQRLSWYFECDGCQYKAFYCHEMEAHKHSCYMYNDSKSFGRKRKLVAPKRVSSFSHPYPEDSDPDSQPAPAVHKSTNHSFTGAASLPSPIAMKNVTSGTPAPTGTPTSSATTPLPQTPTSNAGILSLDPATVEFDASPDYEAPTIPEIDDNSEKTLDFDALPTKEITSFADQQSSQYAEAFDPDILEIKVEVDASPSQQRPPTLTSHSTLAPPLQSDIVYPTASADASIDSMMSMFGSPPALSQPSMGQPSMSQPSMSQPSLSQPSYGQPCFSQPTFSSQPTMRPHHNLITSQGMRKMIPPPELSIGNVTGAKYPHVQKLHGSTMGAGQHSNVKTMVAGELHSVGGQALLDTSLADYDIQEDPNSSLQMSWIDSRESGTSLAPDRHPTLRKMIEMGSPCSSTKSLASASSSMTTSSGGRYHVPPSLKWRGIQTKPASPALTLEQKFKCCQLHDGGVPIKNLCLQFNQSKAVLTNVIHNKQKIMTEWYRFSNPYITKKQRALKSPAYAEINTAILEWYWKLKAGGVPITGVGIQAKAKEVAEKLGYHTFKASNGWLEYFWKRIKRQEQGQSSEMATTSSVT